MDDTALQRRRFLTGAGAMVAAVAAGPTLAADQSEALDDEKRSAADLRSEERVALLCILRSATARS